MRKKLVRITTVPISLKILLAGQLRYMNQYFEVIAVSADGKEVPEVVAEEGIPHHVVPFTRTITPIRDLKCLFLLIRLFRRIKPDIVHTHTPKAGLIGMMAAWFCRVPVRLHTVAGLPLMESVGLKRRLLIVTERITYACATHVYPNSVNLMNFILAEIYSNSSKVSVIANGSSNGIDTNHFARTKDVLDKAKEIKDSLKIDGSRILLTICRISKEKGIEELVEAFSLIKENNPGWRLMIVGPHDVDAIPLSPRTVDRIKNDKSIISVGFQRDVRPYLAMADIFVFPSYREGFPNVVLQAASMGLPVIASNINGCNEIVIENFNGLLISPKDTSSLVKSLCRLIENESLRTQMGLVARELVRTKFDRGVVWSAMLREYNSYL